MTEELVKANAMPIRTMDELARLADMFAKSGYFTDARDAAQIGVKVLAGREMGFGPFASVNGVHVIQGKPAVGANLMAAAVKAHPKYDYRVIDMSDERVEIEFHQDGKVIGNSKFDLEDAKAAGVKNLQKFPRNMLFARAMSNGVRWFTPDVFMGSSVYTPEELGGDVDEEEVIVTPTQAREDVTTVQVDVEPAPEPEAATEAPTASQEGIGAERAANLKHLLKEAGVNKELEFATLMLGREVTALSDVTEAEGLSLLEEATTVKASEVA